MTTHPWDEIGTDVTASDGLAGAMTDAGVMFNVSVKQGFFYAADNATKQAEGYYYIVRDDINAALGACKSRFTPLQNDEAFAFFQPLVDDGICVLNTIGMFGIGQKVWVLAEVVGSKFTVVEGDDISLYLILINAHDGSTSVMVGLIPIRIWCSNMFGMLNQFESQIVKFKHTGDPAEKLKGVSDFIQGQLLEFESFVPRLRTLTEKIISPKELDVYYRYVFKVPMKEASTQAENKIKRLKELFIHGQGNQGELVRGTWYAAYNAASEYLNYEAGRSAETRISSLWFGANNAINEQALIIALNPHMIPAEFSEVFNPL